jgi:hypothetical protein
MFDSAINPIYWWGLLAVGAPILIHLINRLRYRRVRWAAMEFLLKSQERNRRKLILEQLILLALRCLLVALVAMFVVRPTWFVGGEEGRQADWPYYHVVLLDDSLSMQDVADPRAGEPRTALKAGTEFVAALAAKYAEGPGTHSLTVLKFSDPAAPEFGRPPEQLAGEPPGQQLTADEAKKLDERLRALPATYLPLQPLAAVQQANRLFENVKEGHKVLHIVSDFRRRDWTEAGADELCQLLAEMARAGQVQVRLEDVAEPRRGPDAAAAPPGHPNLGLVNLVAKKARPRDQAPAPGDPDLPLRVVTPRLPFDLHATVRNFGPAERVNVRLTVKVDGVEKASRVLDRIAAGEERVVLFTLEFTGDDPIGAKQVTVALDDPEGADHLPADNLRSTWLELRSEVVVLLVDPDAGATEFLPDSGFVNGALAANPRTGLRTDRIRPADVKGRKDLDQFTVVFLLNVAGVGTGPAELDPEGLQALEGYVARGGSVVFFLGPRVNVASYNEFFYRKGQGLFPAPLTPRPEPDRRDAQPFVDEPPDELDQAPKLRFVTDHPAFRTKGALGDLFSRYSAVNRYFKADPAWQPPGNVAVIAQLANRQPLTAYRKDTVEIVDEIQRGPARFAEKLGGYAKQLADAVLDAELKRARKGPLIDAISGLLNDPDLAEYWADAARRAFRAKVEKFLQTLTTGDPLVLESGPVPGRRKGRVVAFMTTAGPTPIRGKDYEWNNWGTLDMAGFYVPILLDLHRYLDALTRAARESEVNRLIGPPAELRLDRERYHPQVELWYQKEGEAAPVKVDVVTAVEDRSELVARLRPVRGPGFYRIRLNQPTPDGGFTPRGDPEERLLAFNVDNRVEGSLARVAETDLHERLAAGLQKEPTRMAAPESLAFVRGRPWFVQATAEGLGEELVRTASWSDYSWILLLFLGLLTLEQFCAMAFSHHLKA